MTFKMPHLGSGLKQTSPLYQEITKSVDKDGNIVTTTNIAATEGTKGTPGYTIKGTPPTPKVKPVEKPATKYPSTGPNESQGEADIRWTEYLKKKNNSNPNPNPVPEVIPPIVEPGKPGGGTPPSTTTSVGSGGKNDIIVPAIPGKPGKPGSSSSVIETAPPKPMTGNLKASINKPFKTKGSLYGPPLPKAPDLRPVGRAAVDLALAPFDLVKGIIGSITSKGGCRTGCKETVGDNMGILGGTNSIRRRWLNGGTGQ